MERCCYEYWKSEASDYSTSSPWAYNGSVITGGVAGEWAEINVGEKVYVNKLELMANSPYIFRSPEKFHLLGSNDGNTWTTLLTKENKMYLHICLEAHMEGGHI